MDTSIVLDIASPRRQSAKAAANAFGDSNSLTGGSDDDRGASVKRRAAVQRKHGKRAKSNKTTSSVREKVKSNSPSASGSTLRSLPAPVAVSSLTVPPRPRPRPRPHPIVKKAPMPPSLPLHLPTELGDLSDLTSLSSSETCSNSPEEVDFVETTSKSVGQASISKAVKRGSEPAWKATSLGTYVWVLIDPTTMDVCDQEENTDEQEGLWWPGKLQSPKRTDLPLRVKLFGSGFKSVQIHVPSDANILSQSISLFNLRFKTPTFSPPRSVSLDNLLASPKKKQKRDGDEIEQRWNDALVEMKVDATPLPADSDSDSDLPQYISQFKAPAPTKPSHGDSRIITKKGKRKREDNPDSDVDVDVDAIDVDKDEASMVTIPGELILAKDKAQTDLYWPARIESYIPPEKGRQKGKYNVLWVDTTRGDVERKWFYVMTDPEFATCKLGKILSRVVEVVNDEDGDEDIHSRINFLRRSPSPAPLDSPPSPEEFIKLSLREQFAYTKNVLQAILNNEYQPSKEKHDKFIIGGYYRNSVVDAAWKRGSMDPKDVDHLQVFIREWCLRDGGRVTRRDSLSPDPNAARKEGGAAERGVPVETPTAGPSLTVSGQDDLDAMRFVSPPLTDALVSSPPEMPPSSCPTSGVEAEPSSVSGIDRVSDAEMSPPPSSFVAASVATTEPLTTAGEGINDELSELTNMRDDQTAFDLPSRPRQQGCEDFESLIPVAKVDYCTNVLLPEAIRQILLWRSGDRKSIELLSPEEEKVLFQKGQTLLEEKDWVMDIMRVREAKIRELKGKQERMMQRAQGRNGRSSTRPRRNVYTPNYQE